MPQKQHARQLWADRAGLDDFRVAAESGPLLSQNSTDRQEAERRLRRQRLSKRLHQLGARSVFELLDEIGRHHPDVVDDIDRRLSRFVAELDPVKLAITGGDRFAPGPPLRAIGGAR